MLSVVMASVSVVSVAAPNSDYYLVGQKFDCIGRVDVEAAPGQSLHLAFSLIFYAVVVTVLLDFL